MVLIILGLGFALLPLLLRLDVPLLYSILMLTVFHDRYQTHAALADGILFAMAGLAALSWAAALARYLWALLEDWRKERAMAERLAYRVRQARAAGGYAINTEGLF